MVQPAMAVDATVGACVGAWVGPAVGQYPGAVGEDVGGDIASTQTLNPVEITEESDSKWYLVTPYTAVDSGRACEEPSPPQYLALLPLASSTSR